MLSPPKSRSLGCDGARGELLMKASFAKRLPSLFHRSHFDWATGFSFVLEVRRQQTTPRPDCQYTTSFARCSLILFHRSHFGWVMESVRCSETESHQVSPLGRRSSVAKSFSSIAF